MFYTLLNIGLLFLDALTVAAIDLLIGSRRKEIKCDCIIIRFPMERV